MATPRSKKSKSARDMRRSHLALKTNAVMECPNCGESVCFDDSIDPENLTCPACGETFDCTCDGECECCEGCDEE